MNTATTERPSTEQPSTERITGRVIEVDTTTRTLLLAVGTRQHSVIVAPHARVVSLLDDGDRLAQEEIPFAEIEVDALVEVDLPARERRVSEFVTVRTER